VEFDHAAAAEVPTIHDSIAGASSSLEPSVAREDIRLVHTAA
jgi:hypothetical protein